MGKWHKVTGEKPWSPCDGCEVGRSAYSHKIVKGESYIKIDHCQETCKRYKDFRAGMLKPPKKEDHSSRTMVFHNRGHSYGLPVDASQRRM